MTDDWTVLFGGKRRLDLGGGRSLRLLGAMELLEAGREAEAMAGDAGERALRANACLLARALERRGRGVFSDGGAVLKALTPGEIEALARRWSEFSRSEDPSPGGRRERVDALKGSLEHAPDARLYWRVLKTFGALPTEERVRSMTGRDFLWCALNLALDGEEALDALCPACRAEAEEGRCPVCGEPVSGCLAGQNAAFDEARFLRMGRGEKE